MMDRRTFLTGIALTAAIRRLGAPQPLKRRSVLLIVADDQGLDAGCYGNTAVRTPNIDRLAAEGVRFTHGFAAVSSCSPSRSVMYTGLYNHTSGQYGLAHDIHNQHTLDWVEPVPKLLRAAGYGTGIIGKMHVKPEPLYGFEEQIEVREFAGNRNVAAMARRAGQFFAAHRDRPLFLVVGFGDPHRAARDFANDRAYPGVGKVIYDPNTVRIPYHLPDLPEIRRDLADYYESISRLDRGVGLLLDELKAAGRESETLIIYVSDNGIPFPGAKTTLYDAGIKLPLIIASPELSHRGSTTDAMASWVDLAPTILEWTGVKGPSGYELPGRSLLPVLGEEHPRGWDEIYGSHTFHEITMYYPMRAVRTRRYKYILNLAHQGPYPLASDISSSGSWKTIVAQKLKNLGERSLDVYFNRLREELYDLEHDPNELRDVAQDPSYSAVLAEMRQTMRAFREKTRDPWLEKEQELRVRA